MTETEATTIGGDALVFLAEHPDALVRFFELSGVDPAAVRAQAQDPGFLGFLLDFVRGDETLAAAFCARSGLDGARLAAARQALPGGAEPNWT